MSLVNNGNPTSHISAWTEACQKALYRKFLDKADNGNPIAGEEVSINRIGRNRKEQEQSNNGNPETEKGTGRNHIEKKKGVIGNNNGNPWIEKETGEGGKEEKFLRKEVIMVILSNVKLKNKLE